MSKYITYTLEAIEDIKLAKTNAQIDSEESMDYITGSSIRGAYIYKYIMKNKISDINAGEHRDKLLKGGIKFLNAYPMFEDTRSIPFPKCYFAPKQEIRCFDKSINIKMSVDKELMPGYEKVRKAEFVGYYDDSYKKINVSKKSNLHINKIGEKNKLYRYEAIKKKQKFKGIIKIEQEEYAEEVFDLLSDSIVYIGGSKGSGYGKCRIYHMIEEDINPEYEQFCDKYNFDGEIYLLALSDIIYRTDLGEYKTYIEPELIGQALDIEDIKFIDSSIETKRITSFNNKWNCSTPQIVGIKAGSVFKYRINGKIYNDLLMNFMDKGIGERKADGFGRFVMLDSLEDTCLYSEDSVNQTNKDIYSTMEEMTLDDKEQIISIFNKIYEQRVDLSINEIVLQMYKSIRNPNDMKDSQWGNYLAMFKSLYFEEPEKGKIIYKRYMEHLNKKRSSSYRQLNRLYYNNEKFVDFLNAFVNSSDDIDKFYRENSAKRIEIGNLKSSIDSEFVYKKNIKILIEQCRFHLRKGDEI